MGGIEMYCADQQVRAIQNITANEHTKCFVTIMSSSTTVDFDGHAKA